MKKQVPKIFFKIYVGDLTSVFSHEFADIIFCKYLDILEIILYFRINQNTLIDIELSTYSYMIACTNILNLVEEGENYASTISVGHLEPLFHTLGSDMNLFGSNMILFGSIFKFQYPYVMLVVGFINFGVKNQVPKISFKIFAEDLMSVFSHEFADIIFCKYLDIL